MKPLRIGEVVTAINDLTCCDQPALDHDGEDVQIIGGPNFAMVDDAAAPRGFRFRRFYLVRTKDGSLLSCQRHELLRKGENRADEIYNKLIASLTDGVTA